MIRTLDVAAVQLRAHDRSEFPACLDRIVESAALAAKRAQLVVLPEGTLPAYVLGDDAVDAAAVERALERLRVVARDHRCVVVVGAAIRAGGRLTNAGVAIDADGSIAGSADKLFLWHFDRRWFSAGERIAPIVTRTGALGVLVCADGRLPTVARALVDRGAEILVMPTAWVTSGRDPSALENVQADLLARVRAFENGVPFVAANKCGVERGMVAYSGKSQAIDAGGTVVAIAGEREPETIVATLELGAGRPYRTVPVRPTPLAGVTFAPMRVAISACALPGDAGARLHLLDDAFALAPPLRCGTLEGAPIPAVAVEDAEVLDPAGLVGYVQAGYPLIVWVVRESGAWVAPLARARALELRAYVGVIDAHAGRAFAVDPDGSVVAGTFGDFRIASFAFDPRKTREREVAPGTDIGIGLSRVEAILASGEEVRA